VAGTLRIIVVPILVPPLWSAAAFPEYPTGKAGGYAVSTQTAGVAIGVQPVEDLADQENYRKLIQQARRLRRYGCDFIKTGIHILKNGRNIAEDTE
jgi:hypothetical protein